MIRPTVGLSDNLRRNLEANAKSEAAAGTTAVSKTLTPPAGSAVVIHDLVLYSDGGTLTRTCNGESDSFYFSGNIPLKLAAPMVFQKSQPVVLSLTGVAHCSILVNYSTISLGGNF